MPIMWLEKCKCLMEICVKGGLQFVFRVEAVAAVAGSNSTQSKLSISKMLGGAALQQNYFSVLVAGVRQT